MQKYFHLQNKLEKKKDNSEQKVGTVNINVTWYSHGQRTPANKPVKSWVAFSCYISKLSGWENY